jgi:hypothetical protein
MINKSELVGKYVLFVDVGKWRVNKVTKISGNVLTVRDVLKRKRRIHKDQVKGRQKPKLGLEEIDWGRGK